MAACLTACHAIVATSHVRLDAARTTLRPMSDREALLDQIKRKAVVHGRVTLSSGREADYYVDLRRDHSRCAGGTPGRSRDARRDRGGRVRRCGRADPWR